MSFLVAAAVPLALSLTIAASPQPPAPGFANGVCTESPKTTARPPDDSNASSFASPGATWFVNDNHTVWAWWWGRMEDGGYKVLWVRPGMAVNVTGTRLDGTAGPLRADIPSGYYTSFQASGLYFPSAGCWQVNAVATGESLRFVVKIR